MMEVEMNKRLEGTAHEFCEFIRVDLEKVVAHCGEDRESIEDKIRLFKHMTLTANGLKHNSNVILTLNVNNFESGYSHKKKAKTRKNK